MGGYMLQLPRIAPQCGVTLLRAVPDQFPGSLEQQDLFRSLRIRADTENTLGQAPHQEVEASVER